MHGFEWSKRKDAVLKKERGISFDEAVLEIAEERLLDMLVNINHPGQIIYVIRLKGYVHCVPAVIEKNVIRLITIYPSRKMNNRYKEFS